jgi:hypothetical protein
MKIYPKFHIGTKIAVTFTIISMVGFSALNLLNIRYYKNSLLRQSLNQAEKLVKLKITNINIELEDDIVNTQVPINDDNHVLIDKYGASFFYLNIDSINETVMKLSIILFGIESILFICLLILTFQFTNKFISEIETNERFLNLLLLSFNHKICNFLTSQRINIDIVKQSGSINAINRLETAYSKIEQDLKRTLQLVKTHPLKIKEKIILEDIIDKTIKYFENDLKDRQVFVSKPRLLQNHTVIADENDMLDILYNLMDNAVRYSINYINIKLTYKTKGVVLYISNDIAPESLSGSGLGLEIIKTILKRYNGRLNVRRKNSFIVKVWLPY